MTGRAGPPGWGWRARRSVRWWWHDVVVAYDPARPLALRRWARARSLADLGELTACWVEGDLAAQPGSYGRVDVDPVPGLAAALVGANRAGLVTTVSQAGRDRIGQDGRRWTQLAWVSGFADPRLVQLLACAADGRDDVEVIVLAGDRPGPSGPGSGGAHVDVRRRVPVTWVDGHEYTVAPWLPRRTLREELWPGIGAGALAEVEAATQLAVLDPVPGRNTLWQWLAETLATAEVWPTPPTPTRHPTRRRQAGRRWGRRVGPSTDRGPGPGDDFLRAGDRIGRPDAPVPSDTPDCPARRAA